MLRGRDDLRYRHGAMPTARLSRLAVLRTNPSVPRRAGLGDDRRPIAIDAETRVVARQALVKRGMATARERATLDLGRLVERINERIRAHGIGPGRQA